MTVAELIRELSKHPDSEVEIVSETSEEWAFLKIWDWGFGPETPDDKALNPEIVFRR